MDNNRQTRRCRNHDYCEPCIYLLTLSRTEGLPPFVAIRQNPLYKKVTPVVEILPLGRLLYRCLDKVFPNRYTKDGRVKVLYRQVMPDHLHLLIYVRERLDRNLSYLIGYLQRVCNGAMRAEYGEAASAMFRPGYNDRICYNKGCKDNFYNYVRDNPYRYLVKRLYPEFFVNTLEMELEGRRLAICGNFLLLDNPSKVAVKISRVKERTPDLALKLLQWDEAIRCGGVLVSPFINPEEKKIRDRAIGEGAGVILVVPYVFPERFKPQGQLFNLCMQGRLLLVSTGRHNSGNKTVTRVEAVEMNEIAAQIAALQARPLLRRR